MYSLVSWTVRSEETSQLLAEKVEIAEVETTLLLNM